MAAGLALAGANVVCAELGIDLAGASIVVRRNRMTVTQGSETVLQLEAVERVERLSATRWQVRVADGSVFQVERVGGGRCCARGGT